MSLRLVYVHRTRGTGVEGVHISGIVRAFERRGWQTDVVSPPGVTVEGLGRATDVLVVRKPTGSFWKTLSTRLPQAAFEVLELAYNAYVIAKLNRVLKGRQVAVIYERYSLFNWAGTWLARKWKIPIILEVNDATVITRSRALCFRRIASRIERWVFKNATHLVTVTRTFRQLIVEGHGIAERDVEVMPNAVEKAEFAGASHSEGTDGPFTLGMVAAFLPWHGLEFVIRASAGFLKETGSRLLLVGDGPDRERIGEWVRELDISGHVEIAGHVSASRVREFIQRMDVCIIGDVAAHASPMKLFEYMGNGKAILAPAYANIQEALTHGIDGWLFAPRDSQALLEGIQCLYNDRPLRISLGSHAKDTVLSRHTWDHRVAEMESWLVQPAGQVNTTPQERVTHA